jgi:hypothetical protein
MNKLLAIAAVLFAGLTQANCGAISTAIDCHSICSRYSDCYDSKYDVSACESRCRGHAADDANYNRTASECSACIGDRACASATFSCSGQCSSVVP